MVRFFLSDDFLRIRHRIIIWGFLHVTVRVPLKFSDLLPLTLVLIKERQCQRSQTTGIALIEICNKLIFAIV